MPWTVEWTSLQSIQDTLARNGVEPIRLELEPRFLDYSAHYLRANQELLNQAGFPHVNVRPEYAVLRHADHPVVALPVLRVGAGLKTFDLVPAVTPHRALLPVATHLDNVDMTVTGGELLARLKELGCKPLVLTAEMGWDISGSLFRVFSGFPAQERAAMGLHPFELQLQRVSYAAGRDALREFCAQDRVSKTREGVVHMVRDHDRCQEVFARQFDMVQVEHQGAVIGMVAFIHDGERAVLVERVGNPLFKKETVFPRILFEMFRWMKDHGVRRVSAGLLEWCLVPFTNMLFLRLSRDPHWVAWTERYWTRLTARGMKDISG